MGKVLCRILICLLNPNGTIGLTEFKNGKLKTNWFLPIKMAGIKLLKK
jgi:hypothetical protein